MEVQDRTQIHHTGLHMRIEVLIAHRGMSIGMIYRCKQVHYIFVLPRHSVDRILCVMINTERVNAMVNTEVILLVYLRLNTCVQTGTLV